MRRILGVLSVLAMIASLAMGGEEKKAGMTPVAGGSAKMIGAVAVKQIPAATYAVVDETAASLEPKEGYKEGNEGYSQAYNAMFESAFGKLGQWMSTGAHPIGAPMAKYHEDPMSTPAKKLTATVGFPVAPGTKVAAPVKLMEDPAHEAAVVQYAGAYDQADDVWKAYMEWIHANGYETSGDPTEVFLKGPNDTQNTAEYLTEIRWPVKKVAKETSPTKQ